MAYAEKRGKGPTPWRVKYKLPSGMDASESGFRTKAAALAWGRDQEARIREGRWADPNAGNITVSEWIDRWLAMQDVGVSTEYNREYLIRRFLRPVWGASPLNSLSTEEITRWENGLSVRAGISRRTARDARSLLCTILGDAAAAKPPLIPYNPALRPRNRGRRTGRKLDRAPQRVWATPLQALLIAERAALLSGRDNDFTMIVTIGYTGLRWAETIGLESDFVCPAEIHVEWQLREINGRFHRLPPKDDSYRSPRWEPCLPVDVPEFLVGLLSRQAAAQSGQRCPCAAEHGGSGQYAFIGPDGGHFRRSNYARLVFRPACDGRHQSAFGRPGRLIITDTTVWPGIPVAAWPPADPGVAFMPPTGRGIQAIPADTPLALAEQRLGHEVPGMRGLYAHASDRMRDDLKAALQARWEDSLRARTAIAPHSPVPLLDELLALSRAQTRARTRGRTEQMGPSATNRDRAKSGDREKMISQFPPRTAADPTPGTGMGSSQRASELAKHQNQRVELRGFEPLTPSMRTRCATGLRYSPRTASQRSKSTRPVGPAVSHRRRGRRCRRTGRRAGR